MPKEQSPSLEKELQSLLNRHRRDNVSNTPDFILARYLMGCLESFETAVQKRETWWGPDAEPKMHTTRKNFKALGRKD